jgi:helix-turn-helix protein
MTNPMTSDIKNRRRSCATADMLDEYGAAERLGLSVGKMRKWRLDGDGPEYIKLGGAVRYSSAALDNFIAAGRRRSTTEGTERSTPRSAGVA